MTGMQHLAVMHCTCVGRKVLLASRLASCHKARDSTSRYFYQWFDKTSVQVMLCPGSQNSSGWVLKGCYSRCAISAAATAKPKAAHEKTSFQASAVDHCKDQRKHSAMET
jgi:hypothetical protein